jgi:hypothetical protein
VFCIAAGMVFVGRERKDAQFGGLKD